MQKLIQPLFCEWELLKEVFCNVLDDCKKGEKDEQEN